ncbi:hypothetical protein AURDEDRAFT_154447 [Auricularia subglabra TFB-10046 SS5]|uniref:Uncharacterized protein n=1 Tax=Auricularia subglabra (strain TFB-10046 / SS5) TaxID=717982 RepID=J0LH32_AURST|nr:hypothetical protein AURDEDRAFT_154447 [Auricularia subglabra TFB-10046 SS5]
MTAVTTLAIPSIAVILETQEGAPKLRITPSQNPGGVMTKLLKLPVFRSFVTPPPPEEAPPPKAPRRGILKNKCAKTLSLAEPKAVRFSDDAKAFDSPVNRTRTRTRPRSHSAPLPPRSSSMAGGSVPELAAQAKAARQARLAANQAEAVASQPLFVPRRRKARVVSTPTPGPSSPAPRSPGPLSPTKKQRPPPIVTAATARGHPVYPTNVPRLPRHGKGYRLLYPAVPMTVSTAIPRALAAPAPHVWAGPPSPISPPPPPGDVQARLRRAVRNLGVDTLPAEKKRELAKDVKHELSRATRARFENPEDSRVAERATYLGLLLRYVNAQLQPPA